MTNDWIRSAISRVQGATSSSHSGLAEITSIDKAAVGAAASLTTSTIALGGKGFRR